MIGVSDGVIVNAIDQPMYFPHSSTKQYLNLGSCAYRQYKADTHCNQLHGYSMSFFFKFGTMKLDKRNWVVDFGSLRPLKDKLEEWFDHTLLIEASDPHKSDLLKLRDLGIAKVVEVDVTGCEGLSDWLFEYINGMYLPLHGYTKTYCSNVTVQENPGNTGSRDMSITDYNRFKWERTDG